MVQKNLSEFGENDWTQTSLESLQMFASFKTQAEDRQLMKGAISTSKLMTSF